MAEGVGDKVKYRTLPMSVYDSRFTREKDGRMRVERRSNGDAEREREGFLLSVSGLPTGGSLFDIRRLDRSIEPPPFLPLPGYRSDEVLRTGEERWERKSGC